MSQESIIALLAIFFVDKFLWTSFYVISLIAVSVKIPFFAFYIRKRLNALEVKKNVCIFADGNSVTEIPSRDLRGKTEL